MNLCKGAGEAMPYYATNLVVQHTVRLAAKWGVSSQEILEHVRLREAEVFRHGGMLPTPQMFDAIEYAATRSGQSDFGLQLGENIPDGLLAGIGIFLSHCTTLGQAAEEIGRHFHLINSGMVIENVPCEGGRKLRFHALCAGRHPLHHHGEMQLMLVKRMAQFLVGGKWKPMRMHLPLPMLSGAKRYEDALECPVIFDTGETAGFLAREDMSRPVAMNREQLMAHVQKTFEGLSRARRPEGDEFPGLVAAVVRRLMASGSVSSASVAGAMNLSIRSLQRRLAAEGSSLRAIISAERARLDALRGAARSASSKKV